MLSAFSPAAPLRPFARAALSAAVGLLLLPDPSGLGRPATRQQQDEEDVVRVSAELVQTDVMVFDRDGKFVEGLKPEQFELKVDGTPQPVAFFESVEAGTVNEDAQLAAARGGARGSPGAAGPVLPLDRGRTVAFFIDDLHLSAAGAARTRQALMRFVDEELGQNDVAAVASASGQIGFLQQFTEEKAVLRAAVGRLTPQPARSRDFERPPMTESQAFAVERNDFSVTNVFVEATLRDNPLMRRETAESLVASRARSIVEQANQFASHTLRSLESLVRLSAPLPGRKVLFFISEGFLLDTRSGQVRERLRRVTDAAARAGVVIYSMDAQGLRTSSPDASETPFFDPTGRLASHDLGDVASYQSPLHTLALETGGRALVNTNSLAPGVRGALKETAKYYLLAWRPTEAVGKDGPKFRRVEVSVRGRTDLRVLVRRGFYNAPPPAEQPEAASPRAQREKKRKEESPADAKGMTPAERELRAALFSPHPRTALPTALSLGYVNTAEAGNVLTSSIELGREAVALMGQVGGRCDIIGLILNDTGKLVNGFRQEVKFDPRPRDAEEDRRPLVFSMQTAVAPGLYQVRVAARDARTGRTGSASHWVEIPDLAGASLALSSVFVAERTTQLSTNQLTPEDMTQGVSISAERRFSRSSWLRFMTNIYSPALSAAASPDLALQVQILRDDQPVFTAPLRKIQTEGGTDPTRVPYAAELPLSDFPAGRYVLQVTAIDRATKKLATQRVTFTIE